MPSKTLLRYRETHLKFSLNAGHIILNSLTDTNIIIKFQKYDRNLFFNPY